jgi:hypothetical protein
VKRSTTTRWSFARLSPAKPIAWSCSGRVTLAKCASSRRACARRPVASAATLETLAYVKVDLVKTRGEFYIARHVAHVERLSTLRGSYSRISAGYAVVEAIDAIPSDGVADEAIFHLLTRVLLTLDDESYEPALIPGVVLLSTLGPRRLRARGRGVRQLWSRWTTCGL